MSIIELKKSIQNSIENISDENFLGMLNTLLQKRKDTEILKISDSVREGLNEARKQISRGEYYTSGEVETILSDWLKE